MVWIREENGKRGLMAIINERRVPGRPRLSWIYGASVALGSSGMTGGDKI